MSDDEGGVDEFFETRVSHLLEEARMILPGIQTLFGFQLIAVFNARFGSVLSPAGQRLHLAALLLLAVAVALVMTPAAYHRRLMPKRATHHFLRVSSRLLLVSMVPLMASLALDVYLVSRIILGDSILSVVIAVCLVLIFTTLWLILPGRWRRMSQAATGPATEK